MASPTSTELSTQLTEAVEILEDLDAGASSTLETNIDNLTQASEGDDADQRISAARRFRGQYSRLLQDSSMIASVIQDFGLLAASPQRGVQALLDPVDGDLFQYFIDNSLSVNSRAITFGDVIPGGTAGTEVLTELDFATHANWAATGDFDDTGGNGAYTHSAGSGTLTQASGGFNSAAVASTWYLFTYTISGVSGDAALTITTAFADDEISLSTTAATHSVYFLSNDSPGDFVISGTSTSGGITIDDVTLKPLAANTGDGSVVRLTTDRNSQDIEATAMTTKKIECELDAGGNQTPVGQERFTIKHTTLDTDELDFTNHGEVGEIIVKGPENGIIKNGSFEDIGSNTVDTALISTSTIPNWTIDSGATNLLYVDDAETFAPSPTERLNDKKYALRANGAFKISQKIRDLGQALTTNTPYIFAIHFNQSAGSATGTLTIRMGAHSLAFTLSGASTGWNRLVLTLDQNCWPDIFYEDDMNIEIEWSGAGGTYLLVDYCIFDRMDLFDGLYYAVISGATAFKRGDSFTFVDALSGSEGKLQKWLWRRFRRYLPHNSAAAETVSDP